MKLLSRLVLLPFLFICSSLFASTNCETVRVQHFENKDVKVWSTTVCPKQRLAFHTHQYARIAISKETGDLDVVYKNGRTQKVHFEKNIPVYLSRAQGKTPHQDVNNNKIPFHITVIELKSFKKPLAPI